MLVLWRFKFAVLFFCVAHRLPASPPILDGYLATLHASIRVGLMHADGHSFSFLLQQQLVGLRDQAQRACYNQRAVECEPENFLKWLKQLWLKGLQVTPPTDLWVSDSAENRPLIDLLLGIKEPPGQDILQERLLDVGEKLAALNHYGLFLSNPGDDSDLSVAFVESDLGWLLSYLERVEGGGHSEALRLVVIGFLSDLVFNLHPIWNSRDVSELHKRLEFGFHHFRDRVFNALLRAQDWQAAAAWARCVYAHRHANGQALFSQSIEPGTRISLPVGHPLMEAVLSQMESLRGQVDSEVYVPEQGGWKLQPVLDGFIRSYLEANPFAPQALERYAALQQQTPNLLQPQQWKALGGYLQAGALRDQVGKLVGRFEMPQIFSASARDGKAQFLVPEVVSYLNRKGALFEELRCYHGLENMFFYEGKLAHSLVSAVVIARRYEEVCYLFFLLNLSLAQELDAKNNYMHVLLNQGNDKLRFEGVQDEEDILKILNFFLFAPTLQTSERISALRAVNRSGATPLLLAARKGLYQGFKKMRAVLLQEGAFDQSDHTDDKGLYWELLHGLLARSEAQPESPLGQQGERLKDLASRYQPLRRYDATNGEQAWKVEGLIKRLEGFFLKSPQRVLPSQAFSLIYDFFYDEKAFPGFVYAPLAVRMSYFEKPLTYLVTELVSRYPANFWDAGSLYQVLSEQHSAKLDRYEERAIKKLIKQVLLLSS